MRSLTILTDGGSPRNKNIANQTRGLAANVN